MLRRTLFCGLLLIGAPSCDRPLHAKGLPAAGNSGAAAALASTEPGAKKVLPAVAAEAAPSPSPRIELGPELEKLKTRIESHFAGQVGRRIHLQLDKPLYKPGETIWLRTWDLRARDFAGNGQMGGIHYQLISPKGAIVLRKLVRAQNGYASNDFVLPEGVPGGEYTVKVIALDGVTAERPVVVSTYEPPRIKKKLEFLRKAYGGGDEVTATITVKRPTGEVLKRHPLVAAIRLDGRDLPRVTLTTNDEGGGLVKFTLPKNLELGDGLLTVMVEDGGVTESVSKRIPIVMKKLQVAFFPEGGKIVAGLPVRLYFSAKTAIGKPADVEGRIIDDHGNAIALFRSHKDGLGRVELTPSTGRTYRAEIHKPVGITEKYALPLPEEKGCTLRTFDDLDGQQAAVRVAVRCTERQKVVVSSMLREQLLDAAAMEVSDGDASIAYLQPKAPALQRAQGVTRITLFNAELQPLAERLIYRNRRARLAVQVTPQREKFAPRDPVELKLRTLDDEGRPVAAELALSVVDDTVLSFADDKTGHILSRLLLEPELPGKVEEPNFYFDLTEKKSALAMELLLGTRGFRSFEWQRVFSPPPPPVSTTASFAFRGAGLGGGGVRFNQNALMGVGARPMGMAMPAMPARPMALAVAAPPADVGALAAPEKGDGKAGRDAFKRPAADPAAPKNAFRPAKAEPMAVAEQRAEEGRAAGGEARPAMVDRPFAADLKMLPMQGQLGILGGLRGMADEARKLDDAEDDRRADKDWAGAGKKAKRGLGRRHFGGSWAPVRVFPAPTYAATESPAVRSDFRETLHWVPSVMTGEDGYATVRFYLSDAITSFRVVTEGVGKGLVGRAEKVLTSSLPFSMAAKIPLEVSAGDKILMPLTFSNERTTSLEVTMEAGFGELLKLTGAPLQKSMRLAPGSRESLFFPLAVTGKTGTSAVTFAAVAGSLRDEFKRDVTVVPLGFPQSIQKSGEAKGRITHEFDLGQADPASFEAKLTFYPSPVATLTNGMEGMLREPSGCFEQASSSNYPNVMVMQYLQENDATAVAALERTKGMLDRGYRKLTGYETKEKGFEWFGGAPAHEALTAYGLVQFQDMKKVYGGVDDDLVTRTVAWLRARRDGKGGYLRNARALDTFGRASPEVTDAYITYSLAEAGAKDLAPELERIAKIAQSTSDHYLLALASNAMLASPSRQAEGQSLAKRLAGEQDKDGSWRKADHSITRSGGQNLTIETTALCMMALLKAGELDANVRRAVEWLNANRGGYGQWGTTQATVLALKAMTRYATSSRKTRGPGTLQLFINGEAAGEINYAAGHREPIAFANIAAKLRPGKNKLEIAAEGTDALPYSLAVSFRTALPATSAESVVNLTTQLERALVKMGETVRLVATVTNKTDRGQPMTMARVGLPGGLTFQTWQLKDLRERGVIAFAETKPREVIVYFRDLKPSETKTVPLDLVAMVPGEYTAPASSAYLYYTDEHKTWQPGVAVKIVN